MDSLLLELLADPNDLAPLQLHVFEGDSHAVREGVLLNAQTGRWYPIEDGIPSLFVDALRPDENEFIARWREPMQAAGCRLNNQSAQSEHADLGRIEAERRARDEQAEDYDRMISMKVLGLFEIPAYRDALDLEDELPILEAGCGTGRLTHIFSDLGAPVVAVDMSRDSIERNRIRHIGRTRGPVHYIHADLTHLPLRANAFGRIAHCGVYEHIPSRALRQQFLEHAQRVLQTDGVLLLSAYRYGGITKLFEKEGEHDGGIPFTRFAESELREEVEPFFDIARFKPNLGIYMSMVIGKAKPSA